MAAFLRIGQLAAASVAFASVSSASAADLASTGRDPYAPTAPIGFASEFPRSPLEDVFVNGFQRFATPAAAQAHCPRDVVVAVQFFSNRSTRPGRDDAALYMCRAEAVAEGERPVTGR